MQALSALVALYIDLDDFLQGRRDTHLAASDLADADRIFAKQRLNDQAYFVLCWGQFEAAVDDICRRAIRIRQNKTSWQDRRGWDRFDPDDKRLSGLSFDERVALVTDCRAGAGSPWARIMNYYAIRNQIAHGRLRPVRIDVVTVVEELYTLRASLSD